jgi:hypothetical protein
MLPYHTDARNAGLVLTVWFFTAVVRAAIRDKAIENLSTGKWLNGHNLFVLDIAFSAPM